ncbi:MAG: transcriptional regulator, MerR family [Acidimicrobiales bacterium]|jgi:DNA-binding transcriptional MerR regulator|nr:transcriptional regulator, MerR family [Acidimicrobiales bacterium]
MTNRHRLDDLARLAGIPTTTVRLYRTRGLLPPPTLEGRTGWYDDKHLRRLRLIARLQAQGFSLAAIGELVKAWEAGNGLDAVIGVEAELDVLLGDVHAVIVDPAELLARFPAGAMTPDLFERATRLGLVELVPDGVRVADRRFLSTGAALAHLGLPLDVVLDEWEALLAHTDDVAGRFIAVFEEHLAPELNAGGVDDARAEELAATLAQLRIAAGQVLAAALDASVARLGRERLAALLPPQGT